jgi:Carboxypeptidase regulatory-like domain/TonB dependent receptor-like, beta-barrel
MVGMIRRLILLTLLVSLASSAAFGQFLSGIEGTVKDSSGAAVSGAKVTITDNRLQVSRSTTTNDTGYFRIDSIAASSYTVRVEMAGFKVWEQKSLAVEPGKLQTIAPVLQVGSVAEQVTVTETANAVNLATASTNSVIADQTIQEVPLSGQNVYGVAPLTPGITGAAVASGTADNFTNEYAVNINAAGLRQEQNGYSIDGAQTNTPSRGGGSSISPSPAIVQSMEVRTNDFDAEKGRNGGATVNVYTKSGSDQIHGSIDYTFWNNNLVSKTHFLNPVPTFKHHDVSASLGGPAIKNKLFWFGAVEVLRADTTGSGSATVETQDFVNWAKANYPNSVALQALTLAPPQKYPTTGFVTASQVEATTPGFFPAPAGIDPNLNVLGTFNYGTSSPKDGYQWSFRGDYYKSDNDRFYVDVIRTNYTQGGSNARAAFAAPTAGHSTFANVNWTHTFGPHFLNEAGINIIRPYGQNGSTPAFAVPNVNVTGISGFGGWGPGNFTQQTVGWRDVATAMVKSHTLKFGFEQFNIRENDTQGGAFDRPTFNFNNILDFIQDEAKSEGGTPVDLATHQEAPYDRRYRELYTGFFVQDDWKIRPSFTLNAGVRYDRMSNLFSIYSPILSKFNLGPGATLQDQVAAGKVALSPNSHVLDHSPWAFTPRLGFNWDVLGKGKTAIRGGFGMFADQPPYLHITDMSAGNAPHFYFPSLDAASGATINFQLCQPPQGFTISCPVLDTSNASIDPNTGGVLINGVVSPTNQGGWSSNYKMTQVLAWSFSIQQQLPKNLILELNYSASEAHYLPIFNNDVNRYSGDLVLHNGTFTRSNANFGTIQYATSNGNSVGHYGSATLTRRFASGLSFRGIYTFGKSLDEISTALSLDQGASTNGYSNIVTNGNLQAQRGRSDFDVRQQFALDFTYVTPNHYGSLAARQLLGGWELGGVWIMQTGMPFWVHTTNGYGQGGDFNADGINWDNPNVPSFGSHLSGQSKQKFLNGLFPASAFPLPTFAPGTWGEGSLGRNTYDSPGYNNFNLTVGKAFTTPWFTGERLKLEARGEFLNLFNRTNLINVDGNLADAGGNFGKATNQLPGRVVQLHFRATF